MKYGYIRCSTQKQDFSRQEMILKSYNIDKIFEEKITGTQKAKTRPVFEEMLSILKDGDTIYFESMSRMARSIQDLIDTTKIITKELKCTVIFLKENLTIGGKKMDAMSELLFNIMGSFAQFERDLIADRTRQGLQAKKEQGVRLGRPETITENCKQQAIELRKKGYKLSKIKEMTGVSMAQVSKWTSVLA